MGRTSSDSGRAPVHAEDGVGAAPLDDLLERQALFGYSHEDVELVLRPMVQDSVEATWSMGDDTPLSIFSQQPRALSTYFKQRFAQVTNPPIDSLREQMVMSLTTYLGSRSEPCWPMRRTNGYLLHLSAPLLNEGTSTAPVRAAPVSHHLA